MSSSCHSASLFCCVNLATTTGNVLCRLKHNTNFHAFVAPLRRKNMSHSINRRHRTNPKAKDKQHAVTFIKK
eukprot:c6505_g1_i2 orf=325-540(+)